MSAFSTKLCRPDGLLAAAGTQPPPYDLTACKNHFLVPQPHQSASEGEEDEKGYPQAVVVELGLEEIVGNEEGGGGHKHDVARGFGGCGSDVDAVEQEGAETGDGYQQCPYHIFHSGGDDRLVVGEYAQQVLAPEVVQHGEQKGDDHAPAKQVLH